MEIARISRPLYVETLLEIGSHSAIRRADLIGTGDTKNQRKDRALALLIEDGLVEKTTTPGKGRHGYTVSYSQTRKGYAVQLLVESILRID